MPKIIKQFQLEITPERFLNACSREEIIELDLLLSSPIYQNIIAGEANIPNQLKN